MNIFELVVNLRNGQLGAVEEIIRSGKTILCQEDFIKAGFNPQIGVTTVIDCKSASGEFDRIIKNEYSKEAKDGIDEIKKIVTKNKILPNLFDLS